MDSKFIKADLHIHTPASKCYKGPKTDEEYFDILKKAKSLHLDMIAITDHNTISGYERLLQLKNEIRNRLDILQAYEDTNSKMREVVDEHRKKLLLFEEITIFPGVEITVNPGIHILVLTMPEKYSELSVLLDSIGYDTEKRGIDSAIDIDVDIQSFLANDLLDDKLVIAPHIDSDKGIYNSLSGQFRSKILISPVLSAMTCNNTNIKEKLLGLFESDPMYKRKIPVAFINASDAHKIEEIGSKLSYIKVDSPTILSLKNAFTQPGSNVSDFNDSYLKNYLKDIIENKKHYIVEKIDDINDNMFICQSLCACLNSHYNFLLIGVNASGNLLGIKKEKEALEEIITSSILKISSKTTKLTYSLLIEKIGNGSNVIIVNFKQDVYSMWCIKDTKEVYILKDKPVVAQLEEIEELIQNNTLFELKKLENKSNKLADNISLQLKLLKSTIDKYDILQKITVKLVPVAAFSKLKKIGITHIDSKIKECYISENGKSCGNINFVLKNSIRLENAILRYTCPITYMPDDMINDYYKLEEMGIIITQNAGAYIANKGNYIFSYDSDFMIMSLNEKSKKYCSIYALLGWIKSSVFIWYLSKNMNIANLTSEEAINSLLIPKIDCLMPEKDVENIVKEIIEVERIFLEKSDDPEEMCKKCDTCCVDSCPGIKLVDEHNESILRLTKKIDSAIFEQLQIDSPQQKLISDDLKAEGIYDILS